MKHKYPIVAIHYTDPSYYTGYYDSRTTEFSPSEVYITGHLVFQNDKKVVIAQECFDDADSEKDIRYVTCVPRICVVEMETLHGQSKD